MSRNSIKWLSSTTTLIGITIIALLLIIFQPSLQEKKIINLNIDNALATCGDGDPGTNQCASDGYTCCDAGGSPSGCTWCYCGGCPPPGGSTNNPKGFHDDSNCTQSGGWTCDADNNSQALTVNFYNGDPGSGGVLIGSTTANQEREAAVGGECGGNRNHGFTFSTPDSVKDGSAHNIYAYAINIGSGGNVILNNSPKSITCAAPTATTVPPTPTPIPTVCAISALSSSTSPITITYSGQGSDTVNAWIERKVGTAISPVPSPFISSATNSFFDGPYEVILNYYKVASCDGNPSSCSSTVDVTLPTGNYFAHCDIDPIQKSGNPFCSYEAGNVSGGATEALNCGSYTHASSHSGGASDNTSFTIVTPTPTPTPVPCSVTTAPAAHNLVTGGTGTVTASVTSGQGSATITQMRFGSYDTAKATVSPTSDSTSIYSTTVTAVAAGATAVWATADLSDNRVCQSTGATDTDVNVSAPTPTPTPIPPTISYLQVGNASAGQTTFSGTYKVSGNQTIQSGSNWLNPIKITVYATPVASITKYYVAFYDKTGGLVTSPSSFLSTIQSRINSDRRAGFLLAYGSGIKAGDSGNKYYVWDPANNNWANITGLSSLGKAICGSQGCSTQTYYTAFPISGGSWKILFDRNFGSKEMYTGMYVIDNNNLSAFSSDITPSP